MSFIIVRKHNPSRMNPSGSEDMVQLKKVSPLVSIIRKHLQYKKRSLGCQVFEIGSRTCPEECPPPTVVVVTGDLPPPTPPPPTPPPPTPPPSQPPPTPPPPTPPGDVVADGSPPPPTPPPPTPPPPTPPPPGTTGSPPPPPITDFSNGAAPSSTGGTTSTGGSPPPSSPPPPACGATASPPPHGACDTFEDQTKWRTLSNHYEEKYRAAGAAAGGGAGYTAVISGTVVAGGGTGATFTTGGGQTGEGWSPVSETCILGNGHAPPSGWVLVMDKSGNRSTIDKESKFSFSSKRGRTSTGNKYHNYRDPEHPSKIYDRNDKIVTWTERDPLEYYSAMAKEGNRELPFKNPFIENVLRKYDSLVQFRPPRIKYQAGEHCVSPPPPPPPASFACGNQDTFMDRTKRRWKDFDRFHADRFRAAAGDAPQNADECIAGAAPPSGWVLVMDKRPHKKYPKKY